MPHYIQCILKKIEDVGEFEKYFLERCTVLRANCKNIGIKETTRIIENSAAFSLASWTFINYLTESGVLSDERVKKLKEISNIFEYEFEDFEFVDYQHHAAIKAPVAV